MVPDYHPTWHELKARQQAERDAWLVREIDHNLNPLYDRVGDLGRAFRAALAQTGCREITDAYRRDCVALFTAHLEIDGFANTLIYGDRVFTNEDGHFATALEQTFDSRNHEGTHAIDFNRVAALHATPYNPHTRMILCPRDEILLMELKERNAIARSWLFHEILHGRISALDKDAQEKALQNHAATVLETRMAGAGADVRPLLHYYRDLSLREYEMMVPRRLAQYNGDLRFVALEDEDIACLSDSLGVKSFGGGPLDFLNFRKTPLNAEESTRLVAMERDFNVRAPVPFSQALADAGLDRAGFLALSLRPPKSP